jgi:hypothetical protein
MRDGLGESAHALGPERRKSPPREGPALLQGLVLCGICGERMKVIYHARGGRSVPDYICDGRTVNDPQPACQWIPGSEVDRAVSELLVELMTPVTIEVTLAVQEECRPTCMRQTVCAKSKWSVRAMKQNSPSVDSCVDPDNRLVADTLEADWNSKPRALQETQQEYERQSEKDRVAIDEELRTRLHTLATDFPPMWRDSSTPDRERKRLARLLLEDVTLTKENNSWSTFASREALQGLWSCRSRYGPM